MGTNYYLIAKPACHHCGRDHDEGPHIGKSSGGWCFSLCVYPSDRHFWTDAVERLPNIKTLAPNGINTLEDWLPVFDLYGIIDEYGRMIEPAEMVDIITKREGYLAHHQDELNRHPLERFGDNYGCIGHGPGPYDYIVGSFS